MFTYDRDVQKTHKQFGSVRDISAPRRHWMCTAVSATGTYQHVSRGMKGASGTSAGSGRQSHLRGRMTLTLERRRFDIRKTT